MRIATRFTDRLDRPRLSRASLAKEEGGGIKLFVTAVPKSGISLRHRNQGV